MRAVRCEKPDGSSWKGCEGSDTFGKSHTPVVCSV